MLENFLGMFLVVRASSNHVKAVSPKVPAMLNPTVDAKSRAQFSDLVVLYLIKRFGGFPILETLLV